jgi:hypothetical protein
MRKVALPFAAVAAALLAAACAQPFAALDAAAEPAVAAVADPADDASRAVAIWHLESYMKNATSLSAIAGVYWSARDMDSSPIGNHHFITIVYESAAQRDSVCAAFGIGYKSYANQKGLTVSYTTIGGFTDNGAMSGYIVETFNEGSDCQAVKEQVNPNKYIYWYKPDYDFEGHRVPASCLVPAPTSLDAEIRSVIQKAKNFNSHHDAGTKVSYVLYDENCACMVGSLFNSLGMSGADRVALGEMSGVDWGEEDLISAAYFDTNFVH